MNKMSGPAHTGAVFRPCSSDLQSSNSPQGLWLKELAKNIAQQENHIDNQVDTTVHGRVTTPVASAVLVTLPYQRDPHRTLQHSDEGVPPLPQILH